MSILDHKDPDQEAARFPRNPDEIERIFAQSMERWKRDTRVTSDQVQILLHPAHLRIIGLGLQALPLILKNLAEGGGPWFVALEAIVGSDPVQFVGHEADALRNEWLAWGREHGYIASFDI